MLEIYSYVFASMCVHMSCLGGHVEVGGPPTKVRSLLSKGGAKGSDVGH